MLHTWPHSALNTKQLNDTSQLLDMHSMLQGSLTPFTVLTSQDVCQLWDSNASDHNTAMLWAVCCFVAFFFFAVLNSCALHNKHMSQGHISSLSDTQRFIQDLMEGGESCAREARGFF